MTITIEESLATTLNRMCAKKGRYQGYPNLSTSEVLKHLTQQCLLHNKVENYFEIQVIFFEIDCSIFYTNLHELFCLLVIEVPYPTRRSKISINKNAHH
jgi:hypothetical protein